MKTFSNITILILLLFSSCSIQQNYITPDYEVDEAYWIPGEKFGQSTNIKYQSSNDFYNETDSNQQSKNTYSNNLTYYNYYSTYPYYYNYYNNSYNYNINQQNSQESNTTHIPRPSSVTNTQSTTPIHINRKPKEIQNTTITGSPRPINTIKSNTIKTKRP